MKKIFTIVILLLFTTFLTKGQTPNCKAFRDGNFQLTAGDRTTIIKRKGTQQSESLAGSTILMNFSVKWTDECTYVLTPTPETLDKYPSMPRDATLTVKIISTTSKSYTQTTTSNFSDVVQTSKIVRME